MTLSIRSSILVLSLATLVTLSPATHAGMWNDERYDLNLRSSDSSNFFLQPSSIFLSHAGPGWLMNALPGSRLASFRSPSLFNRDGDRSEPIYRYAHDVGTLANPFDVMLLNSSSLFAIGGTPKTFGPQVLTATTATFIPTSGTNSWNLGTNWSTNPTIPNGVDDSATFNSLTAIETVNLDTAITVGTVSLTNNSTNVWTLANGSGGSLTLQTSSGNATFTIAGTGNVTNLLSASVTLNSTTSFNITDTAAIGASGALNMTGTMGGSGGFIKSGGGTMSFNTTSKTYTGSTLIDAGILRVSSNAQMTGTSGVSVTSGAQLNLITATGAYVFGTGGAATVTLNGTGPSSSGALIDSAAAGNSTQTLANAISLDSTSSISVTGGTNTLQLNGMISGVGGLTKISGGTLLLSNTGTFQGATLISAGTLNAGATNALGGTSGITVSSNATLLLSNSGTTDRINNSSTAAVKLNGGGTINTGGLSEGTKPSSPSGTDGVAGMGALTLQSTTAGSHATIDFLTGANGSSLVFDSLSGGASAFVDIKNWTGTAGTDTGAIGNDRLLFATDPGLTNAQLANFAFFNDSNSPFAIGGTIIPYGNEFELVAVPEPSTWIGAALALAAIGFTQRRKLRGLIAQRS